MPEPIFFVPVDIKFFNVGYGNTIKMISHTNKARYILNLWHSIYSVVLKGL